MGGVKAGRGFFDFHVHGYRTIGFGEDRHAGHLASTPSFDHRLGEVALDGEPFGFHIRSLRRRLFRPTSATCQQQHHRSRQDP
jgi:hypothetical protein